MKEVHDFIGLNLQEALSEFTYSRAKKRLERKSKTKLDIISWHCAKYGETLHLSFCGLIRHNEIDSLYENLFEITKTKESCIWNGFNSLGDTNESTQYHIYSPSELHMVVSKVSEYLIEQDKSFFNQIVTDNDFYQFLCVERHIESHSEIFALKRILFCYLVDKSAIPQIHRYNLSCCQSAPSQTDFYIKRYEKGLQIIEQFYGDSI